LARTLARGDEEPGALFDGTVTMGLWASDIVSSGREINLTQSVPGTALAPSLSCPSTKSPNHCGRKQTHRPLPRHTSRRHIRRRKSLPSLHVWKSKSGRHELHGLLPGVSVGAGASGDQRQTSTGNTM
jgi:hypothetical protein